MLGGLPAFPAKSLQDGGWLVFPLLGRVQQLVHYLSSVAQVLSIKPSWLSASAILSSQNWIVLRLLSPAALIGAVLPVARSRS